MPSQMSTMMKTYLSRLLLLLLFCSQCGAKSVVNDGGVQEVTASSVRQKRCAEDTEKSWQRDLEDAVSTLKTQLEEQRKREQVAFGASLGPRGSQGPFNGEVTLVYTVVFANVGDAYNPTTGIFTAPIKGVYYFSFSGYSYSSKSMGLKLMKNGLHMVMAYNHATGSRYESATNSMNLLLEKGDQVYMRLIGNTWIQDSDNDHSTFVGHLLFSL